MRKLIDEREMELILQRMFHEVMERLKENSPFLIGVRTRGVYLAERFSKMLKDRGIKHDIGSLDVTFHRDDTDLALKVPTVKGTQINSDLNGRTVVLLDDVIHTGRTIRAALDELMDFGRPERVILVVLIDRNRRELPIQPDVLGKFVPTRKDERVYVRFVEHDGEDSVYIGEGEG